MYYVSSNVYQGAKEYVSRHEGMCFDGHTFVAVLECQCGGTGVLAYRYWLCAEGPSPHDEYRVALVAINAGNSQKRRRLRRGCAMRRSLLVCMEDISKRWLVTLLPVPLSPPGHPWAGPLLLRQNGQGRAG